MPRGRSMLSRVKPSSSSSVRPSARGTLLGEIGLFAPNGKRTMTVRCKTDVHVAMIDYDRFKELYFQNPQFGFRLLHLIVARLQGSRELLRTAVRS